MRTVLTGINEFIDDIETLDREVENTKAMNKTRGKTYLNFAKNAVKNGQLGFKENTETTKKIQPTEHKPMSFRGEMVNAMMERTFDNKLTEVGFFVNDSSKPTAKQRVRVQKYDKPAKITWYRIALLHSIGYRIPLTGEKGRKVRNFLAAHGIFTKKSTQYLHVPPRDIIGNAINSYIKTGKDDKIIGMHFDNRIWGKI